jgi:hypothetical protein
MVWSNAEHGGAHPRNAAQYVAGRLQAQMKETTMTEVIILQNIEGVSRKSGIDQHGCQWVEFTVDYLAEQEDGECSICGKTINSGWLCLDGGDE